MDKKGLAALEFCLAFPLLLVLLGGAAEMGELFYRKSLVNQYVTSGSIKAYYDDVHTITSYDIDGITITVIPGIRCIRPPIMAATTFVGIPCGNGSVSVRVAEVIGQTSYTGIITGHVTNIVETTWVRVE